MREFNFKSSVCTDKVQSERLLALGLKKETADMCLQSTLNDVWSPYIPIAMPYSKVEAFDLSKDVFRIIPAWSLGRLIEMLPGLIYPKEELPSFSGYAYLNLTNIIVWYNYIDNDMEDKTLISWRGNGLFSAVVGATEWLIKEGYFNKEYLV